MSDNKITLRDHFAASAMQAIISRRLPVDDEDRRLSVKEAYKIADAMLAARGGRIEAVEKP